MRKILFISMFFYVTNVYASTCDLSSYESYVDLVNFSLIQLGESDTFKIYVENIDGGISLESGRWLSSDGFLDYITYGSVKYINAIVSDGSTCAGEVIKTIELEVNGELYYLENEDAIDYESSQTIYSEDDVIYEDVITKKSSESTISGYSFDEVSEGVTYESVSEETLVIDEYEAPVINQNLETEEYEEEEESYYYIYMLFFFLILFIFFLNKKLKRGNK